MIIEPQQTQTQKFTFTVEVNIDQLTQAYHLATETDEPESLESMIVHECHWLEQSGLYVQEINQIDSREINITWSAEDVFNAAQELNFNLNQEQCLDILDYLEDNHDASLGINWTTLECAIRYYCS